MLWTFKEDTHRAGVFQSSTLGISGFSSPAPPPPLQSPFFNIWTQAWAAEEPVSLLLFATSQFQDDALHLIYGLTGLTLVPNPEQVKCSGGCLLEMRSAGCTEGNSLSGKGSRGSHVSKSQL